MARKTGSKLRPATRKKQLHQAPVSKQVGQVLLTLVRKGQVASQLSFNRVRRWLSHMDEGSKVDYRTPFYSTRDSRGRIVYTDRGRIVTQFDDVYKHVAIEDRILSEYCDDIEMEERENIGPMSPFLPWDKDGPAKARAVFRDKPRQPGFDEGAYKRALERLASLLPAQSCDLISPEEAVKGTGDGSNLGMDTTTNSGSPWWRRVWKPSGGDAGQVSVDELEDVQQVYSWILAKVANDIKLLDGDTPSSELPLYWATSSQRLVQKGPKPFSPKSKRLVIAYPKEEAIIGRTITFNMMDALRDVKMVGGNYLMAAWNALPVVDTNCQILLKDAHDHNEIVNSGDVSAFDATVPPWLLEDVGRVIASWIRGGEKRMRNLVHCITHRTVLITPSGLYGPGVNSLPSGSSLTQVLGSGSNALIQFFGEELGLYALRCLMVLGDDSAGTGTGYTPEASSETFACFGMESHPDKTYYRPKAMQFLKRLHYLGLPGGIASCYRTLGSCLSLERLAVRPNEWNKFAYIIQALSKLNNLSFNPRFAQTVDFLARGDKLRLGADMTPQEVSTGAGKAGARLLREDARHSWKDTGTAFVDWPVNGVLRGETLPPHGLELFRRVYGCDYPVTR